MASTLKPTPVPTPTYKPTQYVGSNFIGPLAPNQVRANAGALPIGPSSPGFVQGTANTVKSGYQSPIRGGSVLGTSIGPSGGGGGTLSGVNPFQGATDAATAQNGALLSGLNTQYDQLASELNGQLGSLDTQRNNALSSLDTELAGVQKQIGNARTNAQTQTDTNVQDALSTAQEVERSNRNKLRALGILNSSAAGDILSQPLHAYDKQRAVLLTNLQQRNAELDDFLTQKTDEHAQAVKQIQTQYADLVGKIQSDLRFNGRQRTDAIQSANAALQQRLADIQQSQFNWQQQVGAIKTNLATQTAAQMQVQLPGADTSSILGSAVQVSPSNPNSPTAAIYQEQQKKRPQTITGFLGA